MNSADITCSHFHLFRHMYDQNNRHRVAAISKAVAVPGGGGSGIPSNSQTPDSRWGPPIPAIPSRDRQFPPAIPGLKRRSPARTPAGDP